MRDLVVVALERARVKYRFRVYGFVVMPEHLHLLVSEPERAALAQAMGSPTRPFLACRGGIQSLKISSAKRSAASQARGESLWQPRGYDRNVRDYAEFKEKLIYIHRNPVRRGLCALRRIGRGNA